MQYLHHVIKTLNCQLVLNNFSRCILYGDRWAVKIVNVVMNIMMDALLQQLSTDTAIHDCTIHAEFHYSNKITYIL